MPCDTALGSVLFRNFPALTVSLAESVGSLFRNRSFAGVFLWRERRPSARRGAEMSLRHGFTVSSKESYLA